MPRSLRAGEEGLVVEDVSIVRGGKVYRGMEKGLYPWERPSSGEHIGSPGSEQPYRHPP